MLNKKKEVYYHNYKKIKEKYENGKFEVTCDNKPYLDVKIKDLLDIIVEKKGEKNKKHTSVIHYHFGNEINSVGNETTILQGVNEREINISKNKVEKLLKEELDKLHKRHDAHDKNFEEVKENQTKISRYLELNYGNLILQLEENEKKLEKQGLNVENIEDYIDKINNQSQEKIIEVGVLILEQINWAFEEYGKEFDSSLQKLHDNLKKSDNWTTKIKIAVPFLNLIGIKIEHEVKLNKFIKWIYNYF